MSTHIITFTATGHAPVLLPVASGYAPQPRAQQNVSISGGGVIRTTNLAPQERTISIPFSRLTRDQYLSLTSLIGHVQFSATGITITDPFEAHENMHYIRGLEGGRWSRGDRYSVTLTFRKSAVDFLTSNIIV